MLVETIVLAILSTQPALAPQRAHYLAEGILYGAQGDVDRTAALIVIGRRESTWRRAVETCAIPGIGGYGTFGVANIDPWRRLFPGGTCGRIEVQARAAAGIWGIYARQSHTTRETFGRYLGADALGKHPEAILRTELFWRVRNSLECACSM